MSNTERVVNPVYEEIPKIEVNDLIKIFDCKSDLMVLHSSKEMDDCGRYSFVCFDRFSHFSSKGSESRWNNRIIKSDSPFNFISNKIKEFSIKKVPSLPPLQCGVVGYFGYEASHYLEELPHVIDNIKLPDIYLNFYGTTISVDHKLNKCWIVSTGFPEDDDLKRIKKAEENILNIKKYIVEKTTNLNHECKYDFVGKHHISSNFDQKSYVNAVIATKKYILEGDIYEANFTQQFKTKISDKTNLLNLYFSLMEHNPAPFSAFLRIQDGGCIVSASPERFIKLAGEVLEACPIKGTRKRSADLIEDKKLADELVNSEKDRSENIMIVDLMRNDLSRVCKPKTVQVHELCSLKSFHTVHHLVSKITGELKNSLSAMDIIESTFPPGSVTGAPKIRSMEIISELEGEQRGPYCGCIGYISFSGDMDMSVVIRTYFINKEKLFFSAGGAVVNDSDPEDEYEESLIKANALMEVLS